jgi:toxin ParE1/3/4
MGHRLAPQAKADLEEIAYYVFLQNGSLEIADRLIESISARFGLLGAYPRAGRRRDDLRPGMRAFPVGEYIVLYRAEGDDVLIQRVVRGSRDLETLLGD